jgi:hypothetical protein
VNIGVDELSDDLSEVRGPEGCRSNLGGRHVSRGRDVNKYHYGINVLSVPQNVYWYHYRLLPKADSQTDSQLVCHAGCVEEFVDQRRGDLRRLD